MNVALIGFDTDGKVSYEYFTNRGDTVTICDQNPAVAVPESAAARLGEGYLDNLDEFDLVVRTSGMQPKIILQKNPGVASKMTTQIDEFLAVCPTRNIIGVTGTKGKGTTSTLIAKILEAAGKMVRLGGNIGVPPLSFLSDLDADSWVVLELSSFQLSDVTRSPHIGVCLMVVPEHLNWHEDMEEYTGAKAHLFEYQSSDDVAIYFGDNALSQEIAAAGAGRKLPFYRSPGAWVNGNMVTIDGQEVCTTDELKLLGAHNWQNICAAVTAVWEAGVRDTATIRSVLTSFSGLEHRLELVRKLDDVQYYDDSFGTTPETAIVAMQAFSQPKIIVLGGVDKGASYDELARTVATSNVRKVVLVGSEGSKIQAALETASYYQFSPVIAGREKMPEIVKTCREAAQNGDVVLLSPACASFDMFTDYKDRGNQFKAAVNALG